MHPISSPPLFIPLRRADVIAFWTLLTALLVAAAWWLAAVLDSGSTWVWVAATAAAAVVPGTIWHPWFENGVRGWNMVTRVSVGWLTAYVVRVCYYVLIGAVARTGSALDFRSGRVGSRWIPRGDAGSNDEWRRLDQALLGCARRDGSFWLVALLPVAWLLVALRTSEHEQALPFSTYTLF